MIVIGYTTAEVFAFCQEANIPITKAAVEMAFNTAGNPSPYSLNVSLVTPRLRVATPESVAVWLAHRKEKYGIRQGKLHPDDCQFICRRTAWGNFMKDVLSSMPKDAANVVRQAALTALKQKS